MMWGCCAYYSRTWDQIPHLVMSVTITTVIFLIPAITLTIIYSKIFLEAHNSSERTRRNSINPNDNVFNITSTAVAPLNISQSDLRKLQRLTRNSSRSKPPSLPTGRLRRSSTSSAVHKSEPMLQRQNSLLSRSPSLKQTLAALDIRYPMLVR